MLHVAFLVPGHVLLTSQFAGHFKFTANLQIFYWPDKFQVTFYYEPNLRYFVLVPDKGEDITQTPDDFFFLLEICRGHFAPKIG